MIFLKTFLAVALLNFYSCAHKSPSIKEERLEVNSHKNKELPYVLLISIDGFRHDYLELHKPKNLLQLANNGASAKSLKPTFPTLTFPNHYSIATGLRAESHGIVANRFLAPDLEYKEYSLKDPKAVTNPNFYGGVPIWSLARQQGVVSATYFWPGSEAAIDGTMPSYWRKYAHNTPHSKRIETVLIWLKLPEKNRPHLLTLYFSTVDSAGHAHGPKSKAVKKAVQEVDQDLGFLFEELSKLDLPLNIIITSDHGMTDLSFSRVAYIDESFKTEEEKEILKRFKLISSFGLIFYYYQGPEDQKDQDIEKALKLLNKHDKYKTYRRGELPENLGFNKNVRMGELISIAKTGWTIGTKNKLRVIPGSHGFDPNETLDMDGIFIAKGPHIGKKKIERFENIHLYPFIAKILGLEIQHQIDGDLEVLKPLFNK